MADEAAETYAFRCRNCNHLEGSAAAGENAVPAACRVCGAGVSWVIENGRPKQILEPDNWIVLAALDQTERTEVHAYYGTTDDQIVEHVPFSTSWTREPDQSEIVRHACPVCALGLFEHHEGQIEGSLATAPVHHCKACAAARPGTRAHVEGQADVTQIPVYVSATSLLAEPSPPVPEPVTIDLTANEGSATAEVVK